MPQVRKAGAPPHRHQAVGWVPVGKCRESVFSSFSLASYFVVSQSTGISMAQDTEVKHLFKDSFFCFPLKNYSKGIASQSGLDGGTDV